MKEKLAKKVKTEKIILILTVVTAVLNCFVPVIASVLYKNDSTAVFALVYILIMLFLVIGIVYIAAFLPLRRSLSNLKKIGAEEVLSDDYPEMPTLPQSKIYCGKRAMVVGKPYSIFAYYDIAWIYMKVTKAYGIVTVNKSVCIRTKRGKTIEINANNEEINWLIANVIGPVNPGLIVGYGPQQIKAYKQIKQEYKNSCK